MADVRDRALVVFEIASALRRSELAALTLTDLKRVPDGLRVRMVRGKTDQEGRGAMIAMIAISDGRRLNPVAHLEAWLTRTGIAKRLVFRSLLNGRVGSALTDQSVSLIVKRRAKAAGYATAGFAAHSLRAGFLTSAARPAIASGRYAKSPGTRACRYCPTTSETRRPRWERLSAIAIKVRVR